MNTFRKYIIVDDDSFNNTICSLILKNILGEVDIKTFIIPEEGLVFIENEYMTNLEPAILLLDINMPTLSGWEFMKQYEKFGEVVKKQISIYILSSSLDQRDIDKAEMNPYIKGFISKPLKRETILSISQK